MALEALECPNCKGDVELDKDQEFGFCKYCGTKVQNTSIKMVKGKVKIDKKKDLENYYIIARRAMSDQDDETAEKYYDMILQIDPNSWEALFYKTYCNARNCKIAGIRAAIIKVNNCLDSVLKLMKEDLKGEELETKIQEITVKANDVFILLVNAHYNHYNEIDISIRDRYNQEFIDTHFAGFQAEEYLYDLLTLYFPKSKFVKDQAWILLKNANDWHIRCVPKLAQKNENVELIHQRTEKIKETNPEYVEPQINMGVAGCYVATCVYGSYDCPQVWTLRRFRDYDLAENFFGRLFIRLYYAISPTIVKLFGNTKWFKDLWKAKLDKLVIKLQQRGYDDTPYTDKEWK